MNSNYILSVMLRLTEVTKMTNRTKTIRGISFDEEILNKIDEERGIASRSAFVNHLMRKALTEQE